ncbi:MAG: hypothetical protein JWQ74_2899 [Marmoricola sp.]|nr:hypothetical protein [Marmoricola sp.]
MAEYVPMKVPAVAWAFALSCLGGQLLSVAHYGRDESNQLELSMLLGAVVIGWFAYGVLRARKVRVVLVWIVYVLASLGQVIGFMAEPSGWGLVELVVALAQFTLFVRFTRTDYYRWQGARPATVGPSLAGLVAVAMLVGALGGVVGAQDDGFHARFGAQT